MVGFYYEATCGLLTGLGITFPQHTGYEIDGDVRFRMMFFLMSNGTKLQVVLLNSEGSLGITDSNVDLP